MSDLQQQQHTNSMIKKLPHSTLFHSHSVIPLTPIPARSGCVSSAFTAMRSSPVSLSSWPWMYSIVEETLWKKRHSNHNASHKLEVFLSHESKKYICTHVLPSSHPPSNFTAQVSVKVKNYIPTPCWATGIISFQLHVSFSDPMLDGSACSLHHFG